MNLETRIEQLIEPALNDLGYGIVRVLIIRTKRVQLQVMIEKLDGQPITIDDCVEATRTISPILDVDDPINSSYNLEVTSPGLDRPLVKEEDFSRFSGERVFIKTFNAVHENQKKFHGILEGISDSTVQVMLHDSEIRVDIPYLEIASAKLDPDIDHLVEEKLSSKKKV